MPPPTMFVPPPGSTIVPREIFSPVHDFIGGQRKTAWCTTSCADAKQSQPPRVLVDNTSIIREVTDVTQLRRGDHCVVTLNIFRALKPWWDKFVSFVGAMEIFPLYHHFIVLDDVAFVDSRGIPRTREGELVTILDCSSTIREAYEECRVLSVGSWWQFSCRVMNVGFKWWRPHRNALAEYGDMPHIYRVEEKLVDIDRERIAKDAAKLVDDYEAYDWLWTNAEMIVNAVSARREFTSPSVIYVLWTLCRLVLTLVGLAFLQSALDACQGDDCGQYPFWSSVLPYYMFSTLPVGLQVIIQFGCIVRNLYRKHADNLLSHHDLYHLLSKEACRAIMAGGVAVVLLASVPLLARKGLANYPFLLYLGVVSVYMLIDMAYSVLVQIVCRLLMAAFGRFWLIGPAESTPLR